MTASKGTPTNTAQTTIKVCTGHACSKNFSNYTLERAERELAKNPRKNCQLTTCGCQGNCAKGPTVIIEKAGQKKMHSHTDPVTMAKILKNI